MVDSPDNSDSPPWEGDPEEEQQPTAAELEAAGQNSMFGDPDAPLQQEAQPDTPATTADETSAPTPQTTETTETAQPYRVLARKYRPQTFSELIGQEPMVRTLANAIERDRLAHAFLMTGVRGVGKTSTARLIAKALNCVGPDGEGGPTIDPCGQCEPCTAIAEGRHIDVIEMDAASHTGVDDVRDIIEQVRYAAVSARYKIYIIDEVHMLSRNAFNALLKTLEEPPAHVKFLFATTEVEKLPVTVLSRTQRFDLRRIPSDLLSQHFANVCNAEGVEAEEEALRIIAAAAEGSARDGLSILDQAISHADLDTGGKVTAERVRDMLGLADKGAQRAILSHLLGGDAKALIAATEDQYALGVEPLALMRALMDLVHRITVAQVSGGEPDAPSEEERAALAEFAQRLGAGELHRLWQLLLKGHEEVRQAPDPLVSLQMALLRVLHASGLPDPGKLAKRIEELANRAPAGPAATAETGGGETASQQGPASAQSLDWEELVDRIDKAGQLRVAQMMRDRVRVIELAPEKLVFEQADSFPDDPSPDMREALFKLTGKRWLIEKGTGEASPSLREQSDARAAAARDKVLSDPLVKATLDAFPDAELIDADDKVASASGSKWN
ncbi:DNA polymerase III subunit gamma/tau [Erythrobacter rubeus]|uniref:DNA polymerase III subunit gamma/tau n=1 Tax=Erythrobacter rubeus TaxID=2760803 RepID=A0ABR8KSI4_9SPHN|nr:DNA polymerase III subunit gamma/tau [Erythrobacter rubeus]MBD2842203.1 DNA polymerase III subunit gamma/tau [Erythrobacter rubeus]